MVFNEPHHLQTPPHVDTPATKPFFKIGEVAKLLGVKPHVLRYWETEFPSLKPRKNPSGQRIYAKADIEAIVEIKNLLYNRRYTILGAKKMLTQPNAEESGAGMRTDENPLLQELTVLKQHIQALLEFVQRPIEP
jgi:DNA-binding transcriptional MerR regulator